MKLADLRLKIIDRYIIRKFIGTYFFALLLIICIVIVFDVSEKIEKFATHSVKLTEIVVDYYLNFIPYFASLFSPLFVFITVIFFTSKMAYNTEIIAILSSGTSFKRLMYPYFVSAFIIGMLSLLLNLFVIPPANKTRLAFEEKYISRQFVNTSENIHYQLQPGEFVYMSSYSIQEKRAYSFALESFDGNQLKSKLMAEYADWDTTFNGWKVYDCYIRTLGEFGDSIRLVESLDTIIPLTHKDLSSRSNIVTSMDYFELNDYIENQTLRGAKTSTAYIEKYTRVAMPFSTFILTLMGVSLSSRKVRGGIGLHIGLGIGLSFSYILFMEFSKMFVQGGVAPPIVAVWIPNILYAIVAIILYRMAPK